MWPALFQRLATQTEENEESGSTSSRLLKGQGDQLPHASSDSPVRMDCTLSNCMQSKPFLPATAKPFCHKGFTWLWDMLSLPSYLQLIHPHFLLILCSLSREGSASLLCKSSCIICITHVTQEHARHADSGSTQAN